MVHLLLIVFLFCLGSARAAEQVVTPHVRAQLVAHAPQGLGAGKDMLLGLSIEHAPHWHTYWKNPGDSGLPTSLRWTLPAGAAAGAILWPVPRKLPLGPLVNYGYEGRLLLPVKLTLPPSYSGGPLDIGLHAEWLVCKEICLPESGEFTLRLPGAAPVTGHAAQFAAALAAQPKAAGSASARVEGNALKLIVSGLPAALQGQTLAYFAQDEGVIDHAATPTQRWEGERLHLLVPLSPQRSESPDTLGAVLSSADGSQAVQFSYTLDGGWSARGATPAAPAPASAPASAPSYWLALVLAFAGGMLLNLMPCVFPVLALKVLGLARHGAGLRSAAAYSAGVIVSFVALAGLLLALRSGGEQLGWGFQLQSPLFVAAMAVLFTLIGLNLLGVFEFGNILPAGVGGIRASHPLADDALSGVLAVAIASPCSAPFMGAAIGATLSLPAPAALAVFAVLGAGMAFPYVLIATWPGLARLLPRPGQWMVRFKILMAFPMFATVIWLAWVFAGQVGIDGVPALLGVLLALALLAWTLGTPVGSATVRAALAALGLVIVAGTAAWAWPVLYTQPATQTANPLWQPWSPAALAQARAEGKPVFVDFTAAWCVTCQYNKRTALADAAVLRDFAARRVVLLRADWTRADPAITRELAALGRSGVPVYALYRPDGSAPQLLSEILSTQQLRTAINNL